MLERIQLSLGFFEKACQCASRKHVARKVSTKSLIGGNMEQYVYARNDMLRNERRCRIYKKVGKLVLTN